MDSTKFSKMCKDCHLYCKHLGCIEVDLIFKKIKARNKRKIDFQTFCKRAVPMFAAMKKKTTIEEVCRLLIQGKPVLTATQVKASSGIFSKLTDAPLYTGTCSLECWLGCPITTPPDVCNQSACVSSTPAMPALGAWQSCLSRWTLSQAACPVL